jgi:hypothetical protein
MATYSFGIENMKLEEKNSFGIQLVKNRRIFFKECQVSESLKTTFSYFFDKYLILSVLFENNISVQTLGPLLLPKQHEEHHSRYWNPTKFHCFYLFQLVSVS